MGSYSKRKRKRISGILIVAYFYLRDIISGILTLVTWMAEVAYLMTCGRLGLVRDA
jgi:hypothetical protein